MTVEELHAKLGELIGEGKGALDIYSEGCDCNGPVGGVRVNLGYEGYAGDVLLERSWY